MPVLVVDYSNFVLLTPTRARAPCAIVAGRADDEDAEASRIGLGVRVQRHADLWRGVQGTGGANSASGSGLEVGQS